MGIGIQNYPNIGAPDSDYPNGNIVDGATPVKKSVYTDLHQLFAKFLRAVGPDAGMTANGLPENETNGFQYVEAMLAYLHNRKLVVPYTGGVNPYHIHAFLSTAGRKRVYFIASGTTGDRTVYLPPSTDCDDLIYHRYENRSAHNIDLTPESGDTLNWSASAITIGPGGSAEFVCVVASNNWVRVK